jgi:hypothetical protein
MKTVSCASVSRGRQALARRYVGNSEGAARGASRLSRRSRKMLPQSPAPTEAARVPIFDMSSSVPSPKARVAIKSDIVNPIPQSQLAPKIFLQDTPAGGVASPKRVDNRAKSHIPAGFPRNKPRATPKLTGCLAAADALPRIRTPALANANRGMTKKLTQG